MVGIFGLADVEVTVNGDGYHFDIPKAMGLPGQCIHQTDGCHGTSMYEDPMA
jgi:hypothetical protein